ncbi:MAG TPA: hemolysin III family protein [Anaeromyxobacteraceae bacterium]|nr:hemolysin III family protein [Anaeromyxobacteraceae bacterium]
MPRTKPRLRGVSHQIAAFLAAPAGAALVAGANGSSARTAAITYSLCLFGLFAVSALYHRPMWSVRARRLLWRLDHSAIFFLIAGTYTPFCMLLPPDVRGAALAAVWIGASLGTAVSLLWISAPKRLMAALYVLVGWIAVPVLPALATRLGAGALALLFTGGLLYTAGAAIYAWRRPDPYPTVFGFHEIFHLLVVAAAACHFVVVGAAIRVLG